LAAALRELRALTQTTDVGNKTDQPTVSSAHRA
jgi:hypothetical protein